MSNIAPEQLRDSLQILTDFPPKEPITAPVVLEGASDSIETQKEKVDHGISALGIDYERHKSHVMKGRDITIFEREGSCAVCHTELEHDAGLYTICTNATCEAVTHIACLSKHFLANDEESLLPVRGTCPECKTEQSWVDIVKELSLRMRGQKEVEKLLKKRRRGKEAAPILQASSEPSDFDEGEDSDLEMSELSDENDEDVLVAPQIEKSGQDAGSEWHEIPDSEESDDNSPGNINTAQASKPTQVSPVARVPSVVEDSDWDDIDRLG